MNSYPTLRDVVDVLDAWLPPETALSYDNVGLQVGDPSREVRAGLVALDLVPAVVDEAERLGATLVVTHHPLLFRPLRALTPATLGGALALRLAECGIGLVAAHTNLDVAEGGVSFALGEALGLADLRFLQPTPGGLVKVVSFVPATHLDAVREAVAAAGAGRIGAYEACAFVGSGTGYFRPGASARPFLGQAGGPLEAVDERRLEVVAPRPRLAAVLAALRAAHPYEEPATDVYALEGGAAAATGLGAVGRLPAPEPLAAFLERVARRLETPAFRYVGDPEARVETVAVCGGAGDDLVGDARRAGADVYLTSDLRYHRFFDVLGADGRPRMALVDAGHYETERVAERLLLDRLAAAFPTVAWARYAGRTSPIETYVAPTVPPELRTTPREPFLP